MHLHKPLQNGNGSTGMVNKRQTLRAYNYTWKILLRTIKHVCTSMLH